MSSDRTSVPDLTSTNHNLQCRSVTDGLAAYSAADLSFSLTR